MNDCIFCKILKGEIPSYTIYEDDIVKVFLDINPISRGHCLMVPKKHFDNIIDIDLDTLNHMNEVTKEIYPVLKEKLKCDGITRIQNNELGQDIKHYHLHLIPGYENDALVMKASIKEEIDVKEIYEKFVK